MEDALSVHMLEPLEELENVNLDELRRQVVPAASDHLIQVLVHELKD